MLMLTLTAYATGDIPTETDNDIVNNVTDTMSSIYAVAGAGGIVVAVIAIICTVVKKLGTMSNVITSMSNVFKSIFNKDGKIENIPTALSSVKSDVLKIGNDVSKELKDLALKIEETQKKNDKLNELVCLAVYYLPIDDHARKVLSTRASDIVKLTGDIAEDIKVIDKEIKESREAEIKIATPILDKIIEDIE